MIQFDPRLHIFASTLINDSVFYSGFGTKRLGDSMHINNVFSALKSFELSYKTLVVPEQIHSVNIEVYDKEDEQEIEKYQNTDGCITMQPSTVLIVRTADCIPIVLCDKKKKIIAISHQGWRGSLRKMPAKMIDKMKNLGSHTDNIVAAIGPSIGACCYVVDDDRYYTFLSELNGYSENIFYVRSGKRYLDLVKLNYIILLESGVRKEHIDFFPFCTQCDSERFFSFRRKNGKDYKEMFSFIIMRS